MLHTRSGVHLRRLAGCVAVALAVSVIDVPAVSAAAGPATAAPVVISGPARAAGTSGLHSVLGTQQQPALTPAPKSSLSSLLGLLGSAATGASLLRSLRYSFYTVAVGPDGREVRKTRSAIVGVPALVDVDGRGGADVVGTVTVSGGLNHIKVSIKRLARSRSRIPASVEVVAADPTGTIGAQNVAFGYDQRAADLPATFTAELDLGKLLDADAPTLALSLGQRSSAGTTNASLAVIASTFDGNAGNRQYRARASVAYDRAPGTATLTYAMTEPSDLQLTTDRPGRVVGTMEYHGDSDFDVKVDARDMPDVFDVGFSTENPRINYTGADAQGHPQSIEALDVWLASGEPLLGRATHLHAAIKRLTSGTTVTADSANGDFSLVATEPVGEVAVFAGDQDETSADLPAGDSQGAVYIDRAGAPFVIGARVRELSSLRAHVGQTTTLDLVTGGGPLSIHGELEGLTVDGSLDALPKVASIAVDTDHATADYSGSDTIDDLRIHVLSDQPLVAGANDFTLHVRQIPTQVHIAADLAAGSATFTANAPVGLIEIEARSAGAPDDLGPLADGRSGVVLRSSAESFFLFGRLRGLQDVSVSTAPISASVEMTAGQSFTADATVESGSQPVRLNLGVDALPASLALAVASGEGVGGTALQYRASDVVGQVSLKVDGAELLPGADTAEAVIDQLPRSVDLVFPDQGPLARIEADDQIGQIRLAAGSGDVELPARSLDGDPVLHDLFSFHNLGGTLSAAVRLTGLRMMTMSLDPIELSMYQDPTKNRPIDLDAGLDSAGSGKTINVTGALAKPGARTSMSVDLTPGKPTRLVFDDSGPLARLELHASGLSGIRDFDATFTDLSPQLSVCLDSGPACRRDNSHVISGGGKSDGRPYDAQVSMDLEDLGSHLAGTPLTTLNAHVALDDGTAAEIDNLAFENLSMDFGLGTSFKGACTFSTEEYPRLYMFVDSRNRPFVIGDLKFPPLVQGFEIGTPADPAYAGDRIAWLDGCRDGHPFQLDRREAGDIDCGGRHHLYTRFGDVFDKPVVGAAVRLC
jgi:hypothetical protein